MYTDATKKIKGQRMKKIVMVGILACLVTSVHAEELVPVWAGKSKAGDEVRTSVIKDHIESWKSEVHFLMVNQFTKPQLTPKSKKPFNAAVYEVVADCKEKTIMSPLVTYLKEGAKNKRATLVERFDTGERTLGHPPAGAKEMLTNAVNYACKNAKPVSNKADKHK